MGYSTANCFVSLVTILSNNIIIINGYWYGGLDGNWTLQYDDHNYPAIVPGGIYSDLMRNQIIEDVFQSDNDINTRWVSRMNWNYSKLITVTGLLLTHSNIDLIFEGIDTFSTVLINDVEIESTENMFVQYIIDIKPYLKVGNNTIEVRLKSSVNIAKAAFDKQAESYQVGPLCTPDEYNGECHVNHIRKMQASFSWDWGPALPSVGIWKSVHLQAYNGAVLRYVTTKISTTAEADSWNIEFYFYLQVSSGPEGGSINGDIHIAIKTNDDYLQTRNFPVTLEVNSSREHVEIKTMKINKSEVDRWWPNGYGEAKLYTVDVLFTIFPTKDQTRKVFRIGFRTVKLVQDATEHGRLFYFKVNDVSIYSKGSNSIPINILPELGQNEDTIRFLLQSAKDVHMNMLRVWGGGTYESDFFYDLADEMGILIWQDFMFACSMYPATTDFLGNVASEVRHQVRRLQNHPSIILYAGNNENEGALRQNWYRTAKNFQQFKNDYIKLYVDTIRKELLKNDDTRPYLVSSPTNGIQSEDEGHIAANPYSHFYGDVHFYNYHSDSWNTKVYPINRFASEYGYQSLPSFQTWLTATHNETDLKIGSSFLKNRQHLSGGYEKMDLLISHRLHLPERTASLNYTLTYIYYSQIIQAMAVKIETEYNRQWRSIFTKEGKGGTMGALYWQLNDVWVAPTWSSIDFKNNWKMMHYYAKHFFAPVIVTGDLSSDGTLDIYAVCDLLEAPTNLFLNIYVYEWSSFDVVHYSIEMVEIKAESSKKIKTLKIGDDSSGISTKTCGKHAVRNCFLYFTLTNQTNETITPDNFVFPVPLKEAKLVNQSVEISNITQVSWTNPQFSIELQASGICVFVWLEAKGIRGRFSDNGFLQISATKTIYFTPENTNVTLLDLKEYLSVTHLTAEIYNWEPNEQIMLASKCNAGPKIENRYSAFFGRNTRILVLIPIFMASEKFILLNP